MIAPTAAGRDAVSGSATVVIGFFSTVAIAVRHARDTLLACLGAGGRSG